MDDIKNLIERLKIEYHGASTVENNPDMAFSDLVASLTALAALEKENARLRTELEHKNNVVERYAASARSISLYLKEFCNRDLPYDEMISDAARKAETELNQLKRERDAAVESWRGLQKEE